MKGLFYLILFASTNACYLYDINYKGPNLNEYSLKTADAATCQRICQENANCQFWTWISTSYTDWNQRQDCNLKASNALISGDQGAISGPKDCGSEACCDRIELDTMGMGDFYQADRLGEYYKIGNSQDGRMIYQQQEGDNFLYFIRNKVSCVAFCFKAALSAQLPFPFQYWMVGNTVGQDLGGLLNRANSFCPEDAHSNKNWEYWLDWMNDWREDMDMKAKCLDKNFQDANEPEACAIGSVCDDCNVWASVNDVKYCCAENCDHGYVNVASQNGNVICQCYH